MPTLNCIDCGAGFARLNNRGPAPQRCSECAAARRRASQAAQQAKREAKSKAGSFSCGKCKERKLGDAFPRSQRRDGGWCRDCHRGYYVERSGGLVSVECVQCGTAVEVTRRAKDRTKFCSRACKDKTYNAKRREALMEARRKAPRTCLHCAAQFAAGDWAQKVYCSEACSHAHNAERRALVRRRSMLKKKYGITLEQYDAMLAAQGGGCAICRTTDPGVKGVFHVDHCHDTGAVRGLLCSPCNTGLGHFKDDVERLVRAVNYVARATDGIAPPGAG